MPIVKDSWYDKLNIKRPWTEIKPVKDFFPEVTAMIKARINKPWKNRWAALCTYINIRPNGAIITRQQIMNYMRPGRDFTIDTYRNYLTKAQFLAIIGNGKYEKIKDIPSGISRRDVQRLGYDVSNYHKGW